ncbi:transcription elongation factor GreA [Mesorhizobium xinjiangense]|uniref:transcription elongation factor GreA n=1 Tax=Mesorhizobium xinjiangense TaxID=2678685 RepID=UPI0012EE01CF|nr:transcription elongation factor GreA [Mesorhizobium xinjiangense]
MSRAFTREDDSDGGLNDIGERPVSRHRNLVTREGLQKIDAELATLHERLARAEAASDRQDIALVARDLRYWTARRETAEVSVPEAGSTVVRFGMTVTIENEDGKRNVWKIVGEDEADAAHGMISHVSPMAQALFGKAVGDLVTVGDHEWEIVELKAGA